ncbi:hypothetical protein V1512DRAFT_22515 [Lipomyces arxii]|uniref:uncharacterized protein n=1 Tax=Lipomyces arxii TaxID=56418 RepID=UPI0034CFF825
MASNMASMQSVIKFSNAIRRTKKPSKQFACQYCAAIFKRGEHLKRHERSHTSERPFQCVLCMAAFTRKDLLLRHSRNCRIEFTDDGAIPTPTIRCRRRRRLPMAPMDSNHSKFDLQIEKALSVIEVPRNANEDICIENESSDLMWISSMQADSLETNDLVGLSEESIYLDSFLLSCLTPLPFDFLNFSQSLKSGLSSTLDRDKSLKPGLISTFVTDESFFRLDELAESDETCLNFFTFNEESKISLIMAYGQYGGQEIESLLPSAATCSSYLNSFLSGPGEHLPLVHKSFFQFEFLQNKDFDADEETISACVLLVAMILVGAECASEYHFARRVRTFNRSFIRNLPITNAALFTEDKYLGILQARLYGCMFDAWSGNADLIEMALDELPFFSRCCAQGIPRRLPHIIANMRAWIVRESYHRLYWFIFVFMCNMNIAFGQVTIMKIGDLSLPLPEPDELWNLCETYWFEEINKFGHSPASTALLSYIADGEINEISQYRFSPFSVNILLHCILVYMQISNEVVSFCGTSRVPATIELDYLKTMSYDYLDKIITYLRDVLSHFDDSKSRSSGDSLLQIIDLRRNNVSVTVVSIGGICDPDLQLSLPKQAARSYAMTRTIYSVLQYVRPFLLQTRKPVSIEQFLCFLESILSIISWVKQVEIDFICGNKITLEEKSVIEAVAQMIGRDTSVSLISHLVALFRGFLVAKPTKSRWGITSRITAILGSMEQ